MLQKGITAQSIPVTRGSVLSTMRPPRSSRRGGRMRSSSWCGSRGRIVLPLLRVSLRLVIALRPTTRRLFNSVQSAGHSFKQNAFASLPMHLKIRMPVRHVWTMVEICFPLRIFNRIISEACSGCQITVHGSMLRMTKLRRVLGRLYRERLCRSQTGVQISQIIILGPKTVCANNCWMVVGMISSAPLNSHFFVRCWHWMVRSRWVRRGPVLLLGTFQPTRWCQRCRWSRWWTCERHRRVNLNGRACGLAKRGRLIKLSLTSINEYGLLFYFSTYSANKVAQHNDTEPDDKWRLVVLSSVMFCSKFQFQKMKPQHIYRTMFGNMEWVWER